ncbi:hypothetical protein [Cupriavidus sp. H39]|uniref:hypothetical protein n=1 Tax=Cupriavidus sp. H39 TaxID=3401635 RepID=UPI003D08BF06
MLAVLAQFANARKLRLARITPAALECWNPIQALHSPSTNWLLSKCGTRVTLVVLTRNGVEAVRTLTWPEEAWQSWDKLHAAMARESMRLDRPLPDLTTGLGDIPAELFANSHPNLSFQHVNAQPGSIFWSPRPLWPEIDLRPASPIRARLTASALVLGGCGVALTILAGVQCVRLMTQVGEMQNELNHIDRRLAARQRPADTLSATAIKAEQIVAVNGAVRQLNLPWQRLLRNIEEATPKEIALLALEPDAKRASLKGTAEAPTADGMLAYITQLKTQGGFDNAQLTRHEINEQDPMKPFRFQFEAYWSEAGQ